MAGPEKFIAFGDDDPGRVVVEAEMPLDRHRNFDRGCSIAGSGVRDRQNGNERGAIGFTFNGEHDDARPVLLSLFQPGPMFVVPEIRIGDDEARLRIGYRHGPPLFGIEQLVEMRVARVHARRADGFNLFLRQLSAGKAAAGFAETPELLIFVRADEVAGDLAVAGNGNGLALRAHAVPAEVAGELGGRDGFWGIHASSLSENQYTRI